MNMKTILLIVVVLAIGVGAGYYLAQDRTSDSESGIVENEKNEAPKTPDKSTSIKPSVAVARDIIGAWKSTDDSKFTRQFAPDSTVVDKYQDDEAATMQGMWKVFTSEDGETAPFPLQEGIVYLRISTPEEVLFFTVPKITSDTLELTYLGGGGTLRFTKIR